jgi:outer membrane protein OmpA-like peptidoglycan-associated protein
LVLGGMSAAPLAQSPHKESAQKGQFAPMLTLPPATPSSPLRAPESTLEKVTLDAGALFNFDTYELRPEGRVALDAFIVRLQGASLGMIRVTGHADRLGSEAYNQILSEDRAEATKGYLISRGIGPDRVRGRRQGRRAPRHPARRMCRRNQRESHCLPATRPARRHRGRRHQAVHQLSRPGKMNSG